MILYMSFVQKNCQVKILILRIGEKMTILSYNFLDAGRRKRDLTQFSQMIYSTTGRDPFDFSDYGNWCGLGGNGSVVDAIDEYVILYCWTTDYKKNLGEMGTEL